jgi:hypothetical protein
MRKIFLDALLKERFNGLDERAEICDESGRTVGYFLPIEVDPGLDYDAARALFSNDELEIARRQPGGRTTAEVLERLRNL